MGAYRTAAAKESAARTVSGTFTDLRSTGADRNSVCASDRHSLGDASAGNGLWFRHDLLATAQSLAGRGGLDAVTPSLAITTAFGRETGLDAYSGRLIIYSCGAWGKKTGPNPTDRRKAGSKHHILTDAQGIPLSVILTEANRHDVTQLLGLVEAIPPIAGKRGRPLQKPELVQANRGYDSQPHRDELTARGISSQIAKRRTLHGSGLGKTRWVVERTIAWLHQFRRLRVRYERLAEIHEAFLKVGCAIICLRFLQKPSFC
jgi:transposase